MFPAEIHYALKTLLNASIVSVVSKSLIQLAPERIFEALELVLLKI